MVISLKFVPNSNVTYYQVIFFVYRNFKHENNDILFTTPVGTDVLKLRNLYREYGERKNNVRKSGITASQILTGLAMTNIVLLCPV